MQTVDCKGVRKVEVEMPSCVPDVHIWILGEFQPLNLLSIQDSGWDLKKKFFLTYLLYFL